MLRLVLEVPVETHEVTLVGREDQLASGIHRGPAHDVAVLVLAGLTGAVCISWFYSLGWPCFISLVPPSEVGAYYGIFGLMNTIVQPFATLIYLMTVQSTNSHRLAWGVTITPLSVLALLIMMTVNFEKGKIDAGRTEEVSA